MDYDTLTSCPISGVHYRATAQVSVVSPDGEQSVFVPYIVSVQVENDGLVEALGVQSVTVHDGSLFAAITENVDGTSSAWAVIEVDLETQQIINTIDLLGYELANNPDGRDEVYSNPTDVGVSPDGVLHIVDTGANTLYTWTATDGLAVVQSWDNLVPTGIAFGDDGSYYVSFLGTGIAPGAGHVYHFDAAGELIKSWEGMTAVTDVQVDSAGMVYAVELFIFGEQGPGPGQVSMLMDEGQVVISPPLPLPYGLAISPDGELAVSIGAITAGPPMPGQVVVLPSMQ